MAATSIINNKLGRTAGIRVTGTANVNLSLANLAVSNTTGYTENVQTASIRKIIWCGNCAITRGSNTIFQYQTGTSGVQDLYSMGMTNEEYNTANVVITCTDATGFILVEVGKNSTFNSVY
jgi:hypothetical protein